MFQGFRQFHSLLWILSGESDNKIHKLLRHICREPNFLVQNVPHHFLLLARVKGGPSHEQFIGQHSQAPVVDFVVEGLVVDDFGAEVVGSAAKCRPVGGGGLDGPSEVAELQSVVFGNHDVFGLDVAVDDVHALEVVDGLDHLKHVVLDGGLVEDLLLQESVEVALGGVLQHDGDIFGVVEVTVHLDDVFVLEVAVDFDFPSDLADGLVFGDFSLVQELQGHNHVSGFFLHQVDSTVLAGSESHSDFEPVHAPLARVEGFGWHYLMLAAKCEDRYFYNAQFKSLGRYVGCD